MRTPPDLHPDDAAVRQALRDMLVELRQRAGLTQRDLADRCGVGKSLVAQWELADGWMVSSLQRWALGLGYRLVLRPDGLPYTDVSVMRPVDETAAAEWDRLALLDALRSAREELGVSTAALADALGVTGGAVRQLEAGRDLLLASAQRYCRGLGGVLAVEVEPLPLHLDPRQRQLVADAQELVRRVREVDPERNALWLAERRADWRDLLIVLAAMVPADQQPEELLAWVVTA